MKRPEPKIWRGAWHVDFRAFGFGQRYKLAAATEPADEAIHLAYHLLAQLRGERLAEVGQRDFFADRAPDLLGAVIDRLEREKRFDTEGGAEWWKKYARLVRRELGDYRVDDFAPPAGSDRLRVYVRELEGRGFSGRTIRNRLGVLLQALKFCVGRGWLKAMPEAPRLPPRAAPVFNWITEAMFRALRAAIFPEAFMGRALKAEAIERRRVYLSWLMYTGVHNEDADKLTADDLFLDGKTYIRTNTKSARCFKAAPERFEMPEPLYLDLRALEALLRRPFFPGEQIGGGPWPHVSRVIGAAARRLGFPSVNARILRRSYAREMFLHGYDVREVAIRMGHADERMLKEIYVKFGDVGPRVKTRWLNAPEPPSSTRNGMATVSKLRGGK